MCYKISCYKIWSFFTYIRFLTSFQIFKTNFSKSQFLENFNFYKISIFTKFQFLQNFNCYKISIFTIITSWQVYLKNSEHSKAGYISFIQGQFSILQNRKFVLVSPSMSGGYALPYLLKGMLKFNRVICRLSNTNRFKIKIIT